MQKLFVTAVLLGGIAASVFAQKNDRQDQELRGLIKKLTDAQIAYEPGTLDAILTPDYIEISPAGEFDERAKVIGLYKPESKPDASKMSVAIDLSEHSIRHIGDVAVVIVRMNYSITGDGKPLPPRSIRATFVCRRDKGGWKIASAQYTGIRPPKTS